MQRARTGIVNAAAALVAEQGLRGVTMVAVARRGGVAKATVYNHVRDRDELLDLLLADQWTQLRHASDAEPRSQRLSAAASWISNSPVLAGVRRHDPDALVELAQTVASQQSVLDDVASWAPEGADPMAALRWLISFAVLPHSDAETSKSAKRADSGEPIPSTEGAS